MSKILWSLLWIIILCTIFVLGRWYGEKKTWDSVWSLSFTTQSVNSNESSAVRKESWKLSLLIFPNDTTAETLWWSDPATKEVKCPGSEGKIFFSVPSHTDIKMYNEDWSEISTFWFNLSMIAQSSKVTGTLVRAILPKNPFDTHKCAYKTDDDKLILLSIKLSEEFTVVGPDGKSFLKQ